MSDTGKYRWDWEGEEDWNQLISIARSHNGDVLLRLVADDTFWRGYMFGRAAGLLISQGKLAYEADRRRLADISNTGGLSWALIEVR
jgi:hypothetical protein